MPNTETSRIDAELLPLLPLTTGVVLPGMVVTLTIESDEARTAVQAAESADQRLLLVPRTDTGYARLGTVAQLEDVGRLASGMDALVIRGVSRASVGIGVPGTGEATWVQIEEIDEPEPSERARELAREYRAVIENIVEARGVPQVAEFLRGIADDPSAIADTSGYSPDLSFEQKVRVLETVDLEERLALVLELSKTTLADVELKEKIRTDVTEGMEKRQREFLLREQLQAIRNELGEESDEDVVEDTGARSPRPACPRTPRRRPSASWVVWSGPRNSCPSTDGSARGWTGSPSSRGTSAPTTRSISPRRSGSWTRITRAWTT